MARRTDAWTEEQFDALLAYVLRAGVLASAFVIACGGVVFLAGHGLERPAYSMFRGEPPAFRSVRAILTDAMQLHGRGLIQLGLLMLIATPIGRVVFSVLGFLRRGDWLYVGITVIVLGLLMFSLLGG